jgi:hypothetical protein
MIRHRLTLGSAPSPVGLVSYLAILLAAGCSGAGSDAFSTDSGPSGSGCEAGAEPGSGGAPATTGNATTVTSSSGPGSSGNGSGGDTATSSDASVASSSGGDGGNGDVTSSTADSSSSGIIIDVCDSQCGDVELCEGVNRGLDDNCNGSVDEGCPCKPGEVSPCFIGDPSFADEPGCFPGVMKCEDGAWSVCQGGAHAWGDEPCTEPSDTGCHAISAVPFQVVDLVDGTGVFSANADPGSEVWEVACPPDVDPCPAVSGANPADDFQALASGEYSVTYSKTVAGEAMSCTYPLNVGARGLRVELSWNFGTSADIDLHMMRPGVNEAFNTSGGPSDCAYNNCTISAYQFGTGVTWFQDVAPLGEPINWYEDPDPNLNSCFFAPRGVGQRWQDLGLGCHNPRLDLDNISCSTAVEDVNSSSFCAPENTNIDFPPEDVWTRIAVVHYSGSTNQPTLKIFCDGAQRALLGPEGYNAPVTMSSSGATKVWVAADVRFVDGECGRECEVVPVYADPNLLTPFLGAAPAMGPAFPQ